MSVPYLPQTHACVRPAALHAYDIYDICGEANRQHRSVCALVLDVQNAPCRVVLFYIILFYFISFPLPIGTTSTVHMYSTYVHTSTVGREDCGIRFDVTCRSSWMYTRYTPYPSIHPSIHTVHTYCTYILYIHTVHTYCTYILDVHITSSRSHHLPTYIYIYIYI